MGAHIITEKIGLNHPPEKWSLCGMVRRFAYTHSLVALQQRPLVAARVARRSQTQAAGDGGLSTSMVFWLQKLLSLVRWGCLLYARDIEPDRTVGRSAIKAHRGRDQRELRERSGRCHEASMRECPALLLVIVVLTLVPRTCTAAPAICWHSVQLQQLWRSYKN